MRKLKIWLLVSSLSLMTAAAYANINITKSAPATSKSDLSTLTSGLSNQTSLAARQAFLDNGGSLVLVAQQRIECGPNPDQPGCGCNYGVNPQTGACNCPSGEPGCSTSGGSGGVINLTASQPLNAASQKVSSTASSTQTTKTNKTTNKTTSKLR